MKKTILNIITTLVIGGILITGCANDKDNKQNNNNLNKTKVAATNKSVSNNNKKEEKIKENQTAVLNIGDSVQFDKFSVTVNSAEITTSNNEFLTPSEGKEYFKVNMTLENTGNEDVAISSLLMFKMVDDKGTQCDIALVNGEGQLDGALGIGRKMTGDYICEVSKDVPLELEIHPDLLQTKIVVFKLR